MTLNSDFDDMALNCYGFGSWKAPYWFLGPEQGMDPNEDGLGARIETWRNFGSRQLDDCRDFHLDMYSRIDPKARVYGEGAILQRTWGRLLQALSAFPEGPEDSSSRLKYQQEKWGRRDSCTCIIELSGLAARNQNEKKDRKKFRGQRMEFIQERIRDNEPAFVIMYGKSCWKSYDKMADALGARRISESEFTFAEVAPQFAHFRKCGRTILALTRHPVRGPSDSYWLKFGNTLRRMVDTLR